MITEIGVKVLEVQSSLPMIVSISGVVLSLASNLIALAYGYGILSHRVKTLERDHAEHRAHRDKTDDEIFQRLRRIEGITPRLEDAAERLEAAIGNGLGERLRNVTDRLTRLEQHCKDLHDRRPPDST